MLLALFTAVAVAATAPADAPTRADLDRLQQHFSAEIASLRRHNSDMQREIAELRAHTGPVNEVRLFSGGGGGGTRAASASDDMSLILWDVGTGSALQTLSGHRAPVASCALHHHGGGGGGRLLLLSVSWDATVRCWDLDDGGVQAEAIVLPPKAKWGACAVLAVLAHPPAVASAAADDAANADTSHAAADADADAASTEAEVPGAGALAPVSVIVCGSTGAAEVRFSQLAGAGFM